MTSVFVIFGKLHDLITDIGFKVGAIGLALMVLIYCAEIICRYFLNYALTWAGDTFTNILCASIFLVVPYAAKTRRHIEINLIPEFFPWLRNGLGMFANFAAFVICGVVAWMSLQENFRQAALGILTLQNHPIPIYWVSGFMTYGFASSSLYFLRNLVEDIQSGHSVGMESQY